VEKRGGAEGEDRRPHIRVGYHMDSEQISHCTTAEVAEVGEEGTCIHSSSQVSNITISSSRLNTKGVQRAMILEEKIEKEKEQSKRKKRISQ